MVMFKLSWQINFTELDLDTIIHKAQNQDINISQFYWKCHYQDCSICGWTPHQSEILKTASDWYFNAKQNPLFITVLLGDSGVGKSALATRYNQNRFVDEYGKWQ